MQKEKNEGKGKGEEQAARINVFIGIKTTHYVWHTHYDTKRNLEQRERCLSKQNKRCKSLF